MKETNEGQKRLFEKIQPQKEYEKLEIMNRKDLVDRKFYIHRISPIISTEYGETQIIDISDSKDNPAAYSVFLNKPSINVATEFVVEGKYATFRKHTSKQSKREYLLLEVVG